jgi:hypothetical protein
MKFVFPLVSLILFSFNCFSQKEEIKLTPEAKWVFKDIRTKLSNAEKNFFVDGLVLFYRKDLKETVLTMKGEKGAPPDGSIITVEIFPTDMNKDGVEEIFMRQSGIFFGQWLPDLVLYMKNANGKYEAQAASSTRLFATDYAYQGYPELVGSLPEGPGFNDYAGYKIPAFRWNGKKYIEYKGKTAAGSHSIEEEISPAYTNSQSAQHPSASTVAIPEPLAVSALSSFTSFLFKDIKSSLTDDEKEALIQLTGIKATDTLEKTKKGKPKIAYSIYPVDINGDGVEEVFVRVMTLSLINLPLYNYYFYAKDRTGNYAGAPGKIGTNVKFFYTGKPGFPQLTAIPSFGTELWGWNGNTYGFIRKLNSGERIQSPTKTVEELSAAYQQRIK